MRLCSTEGVLQLATCNRTPEVGWRNSGGVCQWVYERRGSPWVAHPQRRDYMPS